ncbi:F-actin-capping protein subunit alpha [Polychytrium aggregatum]|uniref:F-actin-capping protein subunit alpha n=1 Tax=Polychytrium aggregatum TaxID=110093 RepID=UPI0022FEF525|nr:F-actin-capping protein subunit alpha [Polychytrium aggregatum]KAI9205478.1 F-actin-capping protein subunit alpha [Polychytrium aggregatum]
MQSELTPEQRLKIALDFLKQSPPGEFLSVYNDIKILLDDDALLDQHVRQALEEYSTEQFVAIPLPDNSRRVVISSFGRIEPGRFVDPKGHQSFTFDPLDMIITDVQPHAPKEESEEARKALENAVEKYIAQHFASGISAVYANEDESFTIVISASKFNPDNFWNGRWRSSWTVSPSSTEITGTVKVHVHYYEDGNVQLNNKKEISATMAEKKELAAFAAEVVQVIKKHDADFQNGLNESYSQLSENAFKSLRRNLPITRNKMDWNKVANYKLGSELSSK